MLRYPDGMSAFRRFRMKEHIPDQAIQFSRIGRLSEPPVIVDLMSRALRNPELLSLAAGFTDNAVLPRELVGGVAKELCAPENAEEPLQYGQNQGRHRLRELTCDSLARHPGERGNRFDPDAVFLTNGSQQALYLAVQSLCDAGDIVLVEQPSYFVCLELLKGLGVRAVGMPCDAAGAIQPEGLQATLRELEAAGERRRVKAIYLVSYFGNPSGRSAATEEKEAVAQVLLRAGLRIPVLEDAAYRELYFEVPHPAPSVLSLEAFDPFPRLYLGTYTKPFATGLKVGYGYCDNADWRGRMLGIKGHQDFGSAHFNQAIVERMLEAGHYAAYLESIRGHYATKAAALDGALREAGLPEAGWAWERPAGGLVLWMRAPEAFDLRMESPFCARCIERGVLYVPGDLCLANRRPWNRARLAFGALDASKLRAAAGRFAATALEPGHCGA